MYSEKVMDLLEVSKCVIDAIKSGKVQIGQVRTFPNGDSGSVVNFINCDDGESVSLSFPNHTEYEVESHLFIWKKEKSSLSTYVRNTYSHNMWHNYIYDEVAQEHFPFYILTSD
jgi:hypothetical protein